VDPAEQAGCRLETLLGHVVLEGIAAGITGNVCDRLDVVPDPDRLGDAVEALPA
jgi:hypothetical protein